LPLSVIELKNYINIRPSVFFKGVGYTIGMALHWFEHVFLDADSEQSAKEFFYHLSGKHFQWVYD
jgi:hypothetical protein